MSKTLDFLDSLDMTAGQTYRGNCPQCGGKNTFTVTNDSGNLIYNCYKAGCRVAGSLHRNMDVFTIKTRLAQGQADTSESYTEAMREEFELPPYLTPIRQDVDDINVFVTKWNIDPADVLYDVRQERVVFPVYTEENVLVDAVGRSLTGRQPKWLRYASSPVPYVKGAGSVAVIVEDAISAYTIGTMFDANGVALLGTQLTDFHKWYIPQIADRVIIALDPDALDKTLKMVSELRVRMDNVQGLSLKDDIKYCNSRDLERLEELINE